MLGRGISDVSEQELTFRLRSKCWSKGEEDTECPRQTGAHTVTWK